MPGLREITITKCDSRGSVRRQYKGTILEESQEKIVVEAYFDRDDIHVGSIIFHRGDRLIETYFTNRW